MAVPEQFENVTVQCNCPLDELKQSVSVKEGSLYQIRGLDAAEWSRDMAPD